MDTNEQHKLLTPNTIKATDMADWLLSNGISSATTEELARMLGIPKNHVRQRMVPLVKRKEIISPARGLWVPVPQEYRQWGAPEALLYIDSLMKHLSTDYYLGWMTAAALYGASHHASQVFQVAVSKQTRNRRVGRSDLEFYQRNNVGKLPTTRTITQTGYVIVSTRAATMLSVADDTNIVGGLDNAANLIIELSDTNEQIIGEIVRCAEFFPISALRRLGWILDTLAEYQQLEPLQAVSEQSQVHLSKLSMYHPNKYRVNQKWSLDINTEVVPDI